ncbi:MAG TPA: nitroreductase family protein [Acidimicrobiales bacterium]
MDLIEALRTTGAVRDFTSEPVPDDVLGRILDTARFAPSGGNRQAWRVVVVKDGETRRRLRDLYLEGWQPYLAMSAAGLTPWAPLNDREAEARAVAAAPPPVEQSPAARAGFAERLDEVPVLLVVLAHLGRLAAVDRDLGRYTLAGGASVYPFAWNLLLAARAEGLGGVMTTMPILREPEVKALLGAPDELAVATVMALGHPVRQPRRLTRAPVEQWATVDRVGGAPFAG